jgi:Tfp pilus assembly protein PilF
MRFSRIAWVLCAAAAVTIIGCNKSNRTDSAQPKPRKLSSSERQQQKIDDATAAKDTGDYTVALSLFQEILAENPTVTTAYLGIGDIYMVQPGTPDDGAVAWSG